MSKEVVTHACHKNAIHQHLNQAMVYVKWVYALGSAAEDLHAMLAGSDAPLFHLCAFSSSLCNALQAVCAKRLLHVHVQLCGVLYGSDKRLTFSIY